MKKSLFIIIHVLVFCFVQNTKSQSQTLGIFNMPTIDSLIVKKAIEGDADAQYKYGIYLREKANAILLFPGPNEGKDAIEWYEKAALQGHKEASIEAGILYYVRWRATTCHDDWLRRQAINHLKNGGAENDPNLMLFLADLEANRLNYEGHSIGSGKEALMWCNKAINMGLPLKKGETPKHRNWPNHTLSDAYYIMAEIYREKTIDTPEDLKKYFDYLELTVKYSDVNDNGLARLYLGECYYLGLGVNQDQEKANEIWDLLIIDDISFKSSVKRIKDEYSGNIKDNNQYKLDTEEDELRKFLNR